MIETSASRFRKSFDRLPGKILSRCDALNEGQAGRLYINVNRWSSRLAAACLDNGNKCEKSAYTSEYRISVELKFCNIEVSLGAIYRDNKFRRIIYTQDANTRLRGFARSGRIVIVNSGYLNLRSATVHVYVRNRVSHSWGGRNIFETWQFMREATSTGVLETELGPLIFFFCSLRIYMRYNAWVFWHIVKRALSFLFCLVASLLDSWTQIKCSVGRRN